MWPQTASPPRAFTPPPAYDHALVLGLARIPTDPFRPNIIAAHCALAEGQAQAFIAQPRYWDIGILQACRQEKRIVRTFLE